MAVKQRKPLKSLPTAEDYRRERREAYLAGARARRHVEIEKRRHPYRGQEYYYVIHGHAGVLDAQRDRPFPLHDVNMVFYCADGETTSDARARNIMADWPRLLARLTTGQTLPSEHVTEVLTASQSCLPLLLFPGENIPGHGVYFVCRRRPGEAPHTMQKLAEIPPQPILLPTLLSNVIRPDALTRGLDDPVNIHWIGCRARIVLTGASQTGS